jgi:hypothetical protein
VLFALFRRWGIARKKTRALKSGGDKIKVLVGNQSISSTLGQWAYWIDVKNSLKKCVVRWKRKWFYNWFTRISEFISNRRRIGKVRLSKSISLLRCHFQQWILYSKSKSKHKRFVCRLAKKKDRKILIADLHKWRQHISFCINTKKINVWQTKQKESNLLTNAWTYWVFLKSTRDKSVVKISKALQTSVRALHRRTISIWYVYAKSKKRCNCIAVLVVLRCIKRQTSDAWQRWISEQQRKRHMIRAETKIIGWCRYSRLSHSFAAWKEIVDFLRLVNRSGRESELKRITNYVRSLTRFWQRWSDSQRVGRKVAWLLRSWAVTLQRRRLERSRILGVVSSSLRPTPATPVTTSSRMRRSNPATPMLSDTLHDDSRSVQPSPLR